MFKQFDAIDRLLDDDELVGLHSFLDDPTAVI